MTNIHKIICGVVGVAIVVIGILSFSHKATLGDATVSNYPTWYYNGIVIGKENTLLTNLSFGTCGLTGAVAMSNLASADLSCAAPAAKTGDKVFITTPNPVVSGANAGFQIIGAKVASNEVITVKMVNATGASSTPSGVAISGINYLLLR